MRFLHTSDWHLGRTFHGASLLQDQRAMVNRVVEITETEGVSLVIIAGDLFDRAIPPAEAIDLFDNALVRLRGAGATVVAISGNHDSPVRVSAHDRILAEAGVTIRGNVERSADPMVLPGGDGGPPVAVYPIPYLEPSVAAPILLDPAHFIEASPVAPSPGIQLDPLDAPDHPPDVSATMVTPSLFDFLPTDPPVAAEAEEPQSPDPSERTTRRRRAGHHDVTIAATRAIRTDLAQRGHLRSIVVAHTFLTGGARCDSERDLSLGNVDTVGINAFDQFHYVALGHLHGRQRFDGDRIAYSGSPLPYSFSEAPHVKSVSVVDMDPEGALEVNRIPLDVGRKLATVEGTLEHLLNDREFSAVEGARLRARLTDRRLPPQAMARLRQRFPHAVELRHTPADAVEPAPATSGKDRRSSDPLMVTGRFLAEVHRTAVDPHETELLRQAFAAAHDSSHETAFGQGVTT